MPSLRPRRGICGGDETAAECAEDCAEPTGCGGRERYLRFEDGELRVATEDLRVAWLATSPGLALARTGVTGDGRARESTNTFRAPASPGPVVAWIVLRDDRGGATWRELHLDVR